VPEIAAPLKIAKIKATGAEVVVEGATYFDAQELCDAYVADSGALAIHPYRRPRLSPDKERSASNGRRTSPASAPRRSMRFSSRSAAEA
jgi:threonine dehydratase